MLRQLGVSSLDELIDQTVPAQIRLNKNHNYHQQVLNSIISISSKSMLKKNKVFRSFIGQGYYGTITPSVVRRNVFENPGWYTQYTLSGWDFPRRLEALLNFQTMISDLTGLPISNACFWMKAQQLQRRCWCFSMQMKKNKEESPDKFLWITMFRSDHRRAALESPASKGWNNSWRLEKMELPEKCLASSYSIPNKGGNSWLPDFHTDV